MSCICANDWMFPKHKLSNHYLATLHSNVLQPVRVIDLLLAPTWAQLWSLLSSKCVEDYIKYINLSFLGSGAHH